MTEILGPECGFTDLLDYEINEKLKAEQLAKKEGKVRYHPLRPSSAGHCSRKLALELMEYRGKAFYNKPLIEPHIYRLFELGHLVEYASLRTLQLIKVVEQKYKQQSVTLFQLDRGKGFEKELIEGSCDFVLYSSKYRCIGDVKSKKDGFSSYRSTKWDEELDKFSKFSSLTKLSPTAFYANDLTAFIEELGDDFLVDNLLQLNLYGCSSFMQERGIDWAFLYRYNKNDSRHMEIRFRLSKGEFKNVEAKFNKVAKAVDSDNLPESCDFSLGTIRHAFCDCHKMLPYSETDPVRAFFKNLPSKVWPKDAGTLKANIALLESYARYQIGILAEKATAKAEAEIIEILTQAKISKVKFEDGEIFEVKLLKSPREHFELRRSK